MCNCFPCRFTKSCGFSGQYISSRVTGTLVEVLAALFTLWKTLPKLVSASEPEADGRRNMSHKAVVRIRDDAHRVLSLDAGAQEKAKVKMW